MLRSSWVWLPCLAGLFLVGVACSDSELTYGGPLSLSVTSNAPIAVSDSLILEYDVTGSNLLGMAVTWGDNTVDSVFFAGAQNAGGRVAHLYASDGSYVVTATVTDQFQGIVDRELSVNVSP